MTALDYAVTAVRALNERANKSGLTDRLIAVQHDLRKTLPFSSAEFDACYSHMTLCMELREAELVRLLADIRRVLKPHGLNIYTVRSVGDPDYRCGVHVTEDIENVDGYAIQFFDRSKIARLADGYKILEVREIEEGLKKLFWVALQRQ